MDCSLVHLLACLWKRVGRGREEGPEMEKV